MIAETATHSADRGYSGHDLAGKLAGVPMPVLRTVFGKQLGRRIWERTRRPRPQQASAVDSTLTGSRPAGSGVDSTRVENPVVRKRMATELVNAEILRGMIEYLSHRAGETLELNRRQAQSATLTLCYDNGTREIGSVRLARPTADPSEICEAVSELFRTFEAGDAALESINLTTSSVEVESVVEVAPDLSCALAGARS